MIAPTTRDDAAPAPPGRLPAGLPWHAEAGGAAYAVLSLPAERILAITRANDLFNMQPSGTNFAPAQ
jgi:hypothetical protein